MQEYKVLYLKNFNTGARVGCKYGFKLLSSQREKDILEIQNIYETHFFKDQVLKNCLTFHYSEWNLSQGSLWINYRLIY